MTKKALREKTEQFLTCYSISMENSYNWIELKFQLASKQKKQKKLGRILFNDCLLTSSLICYGEEKNTVTV
jgi:hypothetical protein